MVATLGLAAVACAGPLIAQALPEALVKAEMIRRFPEFVEWPVAALSAKDDIALCFSPSHPFGSTLDGLGQGPPVRGHGVQIRELRKGDVPDGCHVLYVAQADQALLARARQLPILTVGDQRDFCHAGGVVNFRVVDGRVRFEVHIGQARKVRLKIDSQFLRLATVVFGGRP